MSRRTSRSHTALGLVALTGALLAAACSGPGDDSGPEQTETTDAVAGAPSCGDEPITMQGYFETGFPMPKALTDEFTKQYPNVRWNIREDQFAVITQNAPRLLAENPPDLMRLPQLSELVKDDLLKDLDGYAKAFGWDKWPEGQLEQLRLGPGGRPRGEGPLYGMGLNFSMTGVFYNEKLAERIGMTSPPTSLAEFDGALEKAEKAGVTPIVQFNGGATGGFAFPLQNLMAAYGDPGPINEWIFQKEGATIDTPPNRDAARHLEKWVEAGYFDPDGNAMDYAKMMSKFIAGDGLFMFNGDWESGNLDKQMKGDAGFFLFPPAAEGGKPATMSAPLTFGIGKNAKNADCAAFFLDWVATDDKARAIAVDVGGSHPMGLPDASMPETEKGTVTAETLAAGAEIAAADGAMDFIANATGSIYAESWTPQLQKLAAGEVTSRQLLEAVQSDYERQVED
ncbi:ABC transporter substrate-binding protein [Streptomyces sp. CNQ-509]|uniref:ABC transporter substrate-binding protein n=1 Tax=Streptomyces sp. CNQ-509 TaxID=444103 RepID=UPI00062DE0F2|nr:extracellular solute-binding protein [Streptomyces sp. CNQ-509]AKH81544.1 ABC transporter substrate-binding protein [Streptomyces sp. CNQ-509]